MHKQGGTFWDCARLKDLAPVQKTIPDFKPIPFEKIGLQRKRNN